MKNQVKEALKELRGYQRAARNASLPRDHADLVSRAEPRLTTMRKKVAEERASNNAGFRRASIEHTQEEPRQGRPYQDRQDGGTLRTAGRGAVLLELVFSALLAVFSFALPVPLAAAAGAGFTVALTAVSAALLSVIRHRPGMSARAAMDAFTRTCIPLCIIWLLTVFVLLTLGRPGSEALGYEAIVFPICLAILTAISPVMGALLLAIADLADWARPYVETDRTLDRLEAEIDMTLVQIRARHHAHQKAADVPLGVDGPTLVGTTR